MRNLEKWEREMLNEGNTYTFARLVIDLHPEICEEAGFDFGDAVNRYRSRTEYNDGIYILWSNTNAHGIKKYFFDCEMNFRGTKC